MHAYSSPESIFPTSLWYESDPVLSKAMPGTLSSVAVSTKLVGLHVQLQQQIACMLCED